MEKLSGLSHLFMTIFLHNFSIFMVIPAITDVTMSAICPGEDECSLAIYLSGFQQAVILRPISVLFLFFFFSFPYSWVTNQVKFHELVHLLVFFVLKLLCKSHGKHVKFFISLFIFFPIFFLNFWFVIALIGFLFNWPNSKIRPTIVFYLYLYFSFLF